MWRIHFTAQDLVRTRIAPTLGPLAETMFGLNLFRTRKPCTRAFGPWRTTVGARMTAQMRPLASLAPVGTMGVDLWSLTGEAPTIEAGIDALLTMRPEHIRTELELFSSDQTLPRWAWTLAERNSRGRRELAGAALASYRALLAPHWPKVEGHLHAERSARARVFLEGGIEGLLATLHPKIRWNSPVLEVLMCGEAEVHLGGRGLSLVPSLFVGDRLVLLTDLRSPDGPIRLVFPTTQDALALHRLWSNGHSQTGALAALLGHNRAAVLQRIADGCTTSELAQRAGVSLASASQHATVLREAGLITTRRDGSAVLHTLTSLGANLLNGA
ncbi:ArsR/SmtB family transcription factor [Rhizocola hellebori]|uniref:ArsR/SmtB family transcription factor n=1 Tax=Rhizocola hellebori TaxID=1392758 RepID=UPI0019457495|nr:winged helix-turn-helix domain-containing protein [Rhizocola hellebori]